MKKFLLAFISTFCILNSGLKAQNQFQLFVDSVYTIRLNDNEKFTGILRSSTDTTITLWVKSKYALTIPKSAVKQINFHQKYPGTDNFRTLYEPQAYRYLFAPSAFNMAKRKIYIQTADILFNSANISISNQFMIGGGFIFNSEAEISDRYFFYAKWGRPVVKYFNAGINFQHIKIKGFSKTDNYWRDAKDFYSFVAMGVFTYGTRLNNITLSIGESANIDMTNKDLILNLCGMFSDQGNVALITESWYIPNINNILFNKAGVFLIKTGWGEMNPFVFSGALRWWGERITWDFGFIGLPRKNRSLTAIPFIDLVFRSKEPYSNPVPFKKRKSKM